MYNSSKYGGGETPSGSYFFDIFPAATVKGYPVIDGVVNTNGVSFARFFDTSCNYRISAIGNNPLSPDAVHPVHMTGTNKLNVELNSLVFFYEPDLEWITQEVWLQCVVIVRRLCILQYVCVDLYDCIVMCTKLLALCSIFYCT